MIGRNKKIGLKKHVFRKFLVLAFYFPVNQSVMLSDKSLQDIAWIGEVKPKTKALPHFKVNPVLKLDA